MKPSYYPTVMILKNHSIEKYLFVSIYLLGRDSQEKQCYFLVYIDKLQRRVLKHYKEVKVEKKHYLPGLITPLILFKIVKECLLGRPIPKLVRIPCKPTPP